MRQKTPINNFCTPEKKAIHQELIYQLREKKRLLNEADYAEAKWTITYQEKVKLQTQIALEYEAISKKLHKNMS